MKKNLFKICIGSVAFMFFLGVGYPKFSTQQNDVQKVSSKNGMIKRNGSGHFTKNAGNYNKKSNYSGVIYIGEPTEGLLDLD